VRLVVDTVQNLGSGWIHFIGRMSDPAQPAEGSVLAFNDDDRLLGYAGNLSTSSSNDFDLFLDVRGRPETLSLRLVKLPSSSRAAVCQKRSILAISPLEINLLSPSGVLQMPNWCLTFSFPSRVRQNREVARWPIDGWLGATRMCGDQCESRPGSWL
jgi:hypothetical protein